MQGKATVAHHPLHPMLVAFPIGFFGGAIIADIVSIWGRTSFWPVMATWLIAWGVIAALVAAAFGFIDYFTIPMSAAVRRTATTHMVLNLLVVVLEAAAFFVRRPDPTAALGYVLTYVGIIVLIVSGWYGAHLVYVGHLGTASSTPSQPETEGRIVEPRPAKTTVPR